VKGDLDVLEGLLIIGWVDCLKMWVLRDDDCEDDAQNLGPIHPVQGEGPAEAAGQERPLRAGQPVKNW
jgi:hypothetical protein